MKKLFLFLCVSFVGSVCAKDLAKASIAILRNGLIKHGSTCMIQDAGTNIVYHDEQTYIEADIVEITQTHVILRFLVSTASPANSGMLMVRGMPRLEIPLTDGLGMASLNCDGKEEHFMLIASVCPCQ